MQRKLDEANKLLSGLENHTLTTSTTPASEQPPKTEMQSNYVLKLLRENQQLQKRCENVEKHSRICLHGQRVYQQQQPQHQLQHQQQQFSRSCEDVRAAVEESHHLFMHNKCLRRQIGDANEHIRRSEFKKVTTHPVLDSSCYDAPCIFL